MAQLLGITRARLGSDRPHFDVAMATGVAAGQPEGGAELAAQLGQLVRDTVKRNSARSCASSPRRRTAVSDGPGSPHASRPARLAVCTSDGPICFRSSDSEAHSSANGNSSPCSFFGMMLRHAPRLGDDLRLLEAGRHEVGHELAHDAADEEAKVVRRQPHRQRHVALDHLEAAAEEEAQLRARARPSITLLPMTIESGSVSSTTSAVGCAAVT